MSYIKAFLLLVMLGGVAYLAYAALQPDKVIFIVDETDKQMAQAWKYEFELALNYTVFLERTFAEKERLYKLCNDYIYPDCPENGTVKLRLECTKSMLPSVGCHIPITAYVPMNSSMLKVCDVISYDVPTIIKAMNTSGGEVNISRLFHRIVGIEADNFITKGDANSDVDEYSPRFDDVKYVMCFN